MFSLVCYGYLKLFEYIIKKWESEDDFNLCFQSFKFWNLNILSQECSKKDQTYISDILHAIWIYIKNQN